MSRKFWRRGLAAAGTSFALFAVFAWWYATGFDLSRVPAADSEATPADIAWLAAPAAPRGKLLAVVSSAAKIGTTERQGGYELTELSRAYYVFVANGYAVDIASSQGGEAPVVLDDLLAIDYAFLNDPAAQSKARNTLRLADIDPAEYAGVYFVGGKGAMSDFPNNPDIARIVRSIDARGGVIGAVCHGPAALLGIPGSDGRPLLAGRRVTGFSNAEELFLIDDARELFGTLLQDGLSAAGAQFVEGPMYLDHSVVDGRLITGQNPWSTWSVAEAMIRSLGHTPRPRVASGEEQAVEILLAYRRGGYEAARRLRQQRPDADIRLLLMHALVAGMQGAVHDAFQLQRLAHD